MSATSNSVAQPSSRVEENSARTLFTDGLRALANFLDAHPEVPYGGDLTVNAYVWGEDLHQAFTTIAKAMGKAAKVYSDAHFTLSKKFGPEVTLDVFTNREEVCERVVIGKEVIPAHTVPETVREIVEWRCSSVLGGAE